MLSEVNERDAIMIVDQEVEERSKTRVRRRRLKSTSTFNNVLIATTIAEFLVSPLEVMNFSLAIGVNGSIWPFLNTYVCDLVGINDDRRSQFTNKSRHVYKAKQSGVALPLDLSIEAIDLLEEWCRLGTTEIPYSQLNEWLKWRTFQLKCRTVLAWEVVSVGISLFGKSWLTTYMSGNRINTAIGNGIGLQIA